MPSPRNFVTASILTIAAAHPANQWQTTSRPLLPRDNDDQHGHNNFYQAPGPNDARAPCPGMNTLANHGFIPRDGRQVNAEQIVSGFWQGWGMDVSTISTAMHNAFTVCEYVTGSDCQGTLPNLTILAEPHTFEHDHSLSRQDYRMAWANGAETDNYNYNDTIFGDVLEVINGQEHVDYALANEIRLFRMSEALSQDYPGWFQPDIPTQGVEFGFIFGAISDPAVPNADTQPQVRTDWLHYWFQNESFPWPLGWQAPRPARDINFVKSAYSAVLAATVTETPSPVAEAWVNPTVTPVTLPDQPTVPILPLPTEPPYAGPLASVNDRPWRLQAQGASGIDQAEMQAVLAAAEDDPMFLNFHLDEVSLEQVQRKQRFGQARLSSMRAAMATGTA